MQYYYISYNEWLSLEITAAVGENLAGKSVDNASGMGGEFGVTSIGSISTYPAPLSTPGPPMVFRPYQPTFGGALLTMSAVDSVNVTVDVPDWYAVEPNLTFVGFATIWNQAIPIVFPGDLFSLHLTFSIPPYTDFSGTAPARDITFVGGSTRMYEPDGTTSGENTLFYNSRNESAQSHNSTIDVSFDDTKLAVETTQETVSTGTIRTYGWQFRRIKLDPPTGATFSFESKPIDEFERYALFETDGTFWDLLLGDYYIELHIVDEWGRLWRKGHYPIRLNPSQCSIAFGGSGFLYCALRHGEPGTQQKENVRILRIEDGITTPEIMLTRTGRPPENSSTFAFAQPINVLMVGDLKERGVVGEGGEITPSILIGTSFSRLSNLLF